MSFKFNEGQNVMIAVKGYEPKQGLVTVAAIGGHKGNENVYWVTFDMRNGRPHGLWFSERELQSLKEVIND